MLGYPEQALARMNEALPSDQKESHAFTRAWVLHFAATIHAWIGELQLTLRSHTYSWEYRDTANTVRDSGSAACR